MGSSRLLAVVSSCSLLLAAGCGGGTKTYSADEEPGLPGEEASTSTGPAAGDFVASTAEGGAFTARFRDNQVIVSFGHDRDGAERIVRGYQRFQRQEHRP